MFACVCINTLISRLSTLGPSFSKFWHERSGMVKDKTYKIGTVQTNSNAFSLPRLCSYHTNLISNLALTLINTKIKLSELQRANNSADEGVSRLSFMIRNLLGSPKFWKATNTLQWSCGPGLEKSFLCQSQFFSGRARVPFFWSHFLSTRSQSCSKTQKLRRKKKEAIFKASFCTHTRMWTSSMKW